MGHHHKKNRIAQSENISENSEVSSNLFGNMDMSSMLGNMNFNNIDFSKIDMNKVKSMMDQMKLPEVAPKPVQEPIKPSPGNVKTDADPRLNFLYSLKAMLPAKRAKTLDGVTKFIELAQLMNFGPKSHHK